MKIFKELKKLGYIHYSATTIEELDDLPLNSAERVSEQALVLRWFREKYNLHAEITWSPSYEYEPGKWSDAIYEITFVDVSYTKEWKAEAPDMQRANGKQLTYEEAELECLIRLIEITKTK